MGSERERERSLGKRERQREREREAERDGILGEEGSGKCAQNPHLVPTNLAMANLDCIPKRCSSLGIFTSNIFA